MTLHYLDLIARPITRPLVPSCERCGTGTELDQLARDTCGWICPACWVGNPANLLGAKNVAQQTERGSRN